MDLAYSRQTVSTEQVVGCERYWGSGSCADRGLGLERILSLSRRASPPLFVGNLAQYQEPACKSSLALAIPSESANMMGCWQPPILHPSLSLDRNS